MGVVGGGHRPNLSIESSHDCGQMLSAALHVPLMGAIKECWFGPQEVALSLGGGGAWGLSRAITKGEQVTKLC